MKITDVIDLFEAELAFGAPGSKAMGSANFGLLSRYYTRPSQRMQPTLSLNFGSDNMVKLTGADVEAIAKYYDTLPADADRYDFVYDTMSRADKFNALLARLGLRQPPAPPPAPIPTRNQTAMDLSERDQPTDPDRSSVRSAALNTALRLAYAKYPQAKSDMEALLMYDMDVQKNTSQELKSQDQTNRRQDDVDIQLRDVNRKQSNKIGSLDDENDALSAELDKLSRELDAMTAQTGSAPERRKDSDSDTVKKSDSNTDTGSYGTNTRSDSRAEKSQKRSTDAEKRKSEPETPPSQQDLASTVPPYIPPPRPTVDVTPAVKPPMPTINVIDQPDPSSAMSQMAQSLSNPSTSSAIGQTAQSLTNPPAKDSITDPMAPPTRLGGPEPDVDADSAYSAARSAEDEPDNVFKFPGSKKEIPADANQGSLDFDGEDELARQRQTVAQLRGSGAAKARNAIRDTAAAAMLEAQQLRRMRELAGLLR